MLLLFVDTAESGPFKVASSIVIPRSDNSQAKLLMKQIAGPSRAAGARRHRGGGADFPRAHAHAARGRAAAGAGRGRVRYHSRRPHRPGQPAKTTASPSTASTAPSALLPLPFR